MSFNTITFPKALLAVFQDFNLRVLLQRREVRQVATLYGAMVLNICLGIGVSIANTRLLGPEAYGQFKLLGNLFGFVATVTAFGYFNSVGRLVAQPENKKIRGQLVSGGLLICLLIALLIMALLFAFSFFINNIFHAELARTVRLFLPLLFVLPLRNCLENLCQGDNRIGALSALRIAPQVLYLIGALAVGVWGRLSLTAALALQLGFLAAVMIGVSLLLRPRLRGVKGVLPVIQSETRRFGFHIYVGSVAAVASAQLFGLLIGYFVDATAVGFYSLALTVCSPLAFVGSVFGTTYFKQFATQKAIPGKVLLVTLGMAMAAFAGFLVLVKTVIILFYGQAYAPVVMLAYIMGGGFLIHGLGDLYNRFLCVHGRGREIRNGALSTGLVSVLVGLIFTRLFGATGAAWAKCITSVTYFLMMLMFYFKRDITSAEAR